MSFIIIIVIITKMKCWQSQEETCYLSSVRPRSSSFKHACGLLHSFLQIRTSRFPRKLSNRLYQDIRGGNVSVEVNFSRGINTKHNDRITKLACSVLADYPTYGVSHQTERLNVTDRVCAYGERNIYLCFNWRWICDAKL